MNRSKRSVALSTVSQSKVTTSKEAQPASNGSLSATDLEAQNQRYAGTTGVSTNNSHLKFLPAFKDSSTGQVELARCPDGRPAPVHLLCSLPDEWATERDAAGRIVAVKASIVAGFVRGGQFYTRAEAAQAS